MKKILNILSPENILKRENIPYNQVNKPFYWRKIYYKEYPRFPKILLDTKNKPPALNLFDALQQRRSVRKFLKKSINTSILSELLYYSAGINLLGKNPDMSRRMYPSAGARYPLELYLSVFKGNWKIKEGTYHYNVKYHSLELLLSGDHKENIKPAFSIDNAKLIENSSIVIYITGVINRTAIKYGDKSYKLMLLEAGHLMQNIYLVSTVLCIGCCAIGGFNDDHIYKLLDLDKKKERILYIAALGNRKKI